MNPGEKALLLILMSPTKGSLQLNLSLKNCTGEVEKMGEILCIVLCTETLYFSCFSVLNEIDCPVVFHFPSPI